MPNFKKGDFVKLCSGDIIAIIELIGSGANADVYRARSAILKCDVAFKYMYGNYSTNNAKYYEKCKLFSDYDSPHPDIIWFYRGGITEFSAKSETFGFIMPLMEGYKSFTKPIKDQAMLSTAQKADAIIQLAEIFRSLHGKGFLYGDVSDNNAMYRIENGKIKVVLIDCDNVTKPGFTLGLNGTGLYRAPEIILNGNPTIESDKHAVSVLAYRILMGSHPLDGTASRSVMFTPENVIYYFGRKPRFVFDGSINAPGLTTEARWNKLPYPLQIFFSKQFSQECLLLKEERLDMATLRKLTSMAFKC